MDELRLGGEKLEWFDLNHAPWRVGLGILSRGVRLVLTSLDMCVVAGRLGKFSAPVAWLQSLFAAFVVV